MHVGTFTFFCDFANTAPSTLQCTITSKKNFWQLVSAARVMCGQKGVLRQDWREAAMLRHGKKHLIARQLNVGFSPDAYSTRVRSKGKLPALTADAAIFTNEQVGLRADLPPNRGRQSLRVQARHPCFTNGTF